MDRKMLALHLKWRVLLEEIETKFPLVLHTDAGRTFSMVRRMKVEKEAGVPIRLRSGFAISTENGNAANEMNERKWIELYNELSAHLRDEYPELHQQVLSSNVADQ